MKISAEQLIHDIAAFIDADLAQQLFESYTNMQQRYYAGDWKPAELDGGQFCEAVARALYQVDSGIVRNDLLPGELSNLLRSKNTPHNLEEKDRVHFCQVLQTAYKFRNDRGVAHISLIHEANLLDANLIIAMVKWLFGEFLRLAWKKDRSEVISIIEALVQFEHPLIHELDGVPLILSNDVSAPEEVLVYLQHSPTGCLTRNELKQYIKKEQSTISKAISRLNTSKEIRISNAGEVVITPLGQARLYENIMPKLSESKNTP